jgi:hypothetical protein
MRYWTLVGEVARPERFELPTLCFEGRCSDPAELRARGFSRSILTIYSRVRSLFLRVRGTA